MDTNRLKQFCVIVETGSLTKAAQLLHITHSGLSKSMKLLQIELKCALLQPSGRGVSITEEGLQIYQRAKEFLALEESLFFAEKPREPASLKIGAVEIFLSSITEQLKQSDFKTNITLLDLEPGQMEQLIAKRQLDFGITYLPYPHESVELIEVGQYNLGCYHLAGTFQKELLSHLPFVVPAQGLSNNPLGIKERDGWLESLYPRHRKYAVNLLSTGLELVMQGLCAIYIPHFIARKINATRNSREQLIEFPLPPKIKKHPQKAFLLQHKNQPKDWRFKLLFMMLKKTISNK